MIHIIGRIKKYLNQNKFFVLFMILLSWLIFDPFIRDQGIIASFLTMFMIMIIILLFRHIFRKNIHFILSTIIILLPFVVLIIYNEFKIEIIKYILLYSVIIVCLFVTISLIWYVGNLKTYTNDEIFAGITSFLLIGICFGYIYFGLSSYDTTVVHFMKEDSGLKSELNAPEMTIKIAESDFIYYSFMTLSTVGYGDIYPISLITKRLASLEACTGVLFIAIFISRIIMLYEKAGIKKIKAEISDRDFND